MASLASAIPRPEERSLLRFITCGSVDDGKSTLIGRLLHDSGRILEDQIAAITRDSARWGTTGDAPDLALLVDGLQAEREQGITIDVAYRYFDTPQRKFILADTPGHEQYTRNMATGASTADLAIVLVDARKGVRDQTRRHAFIATLLGIRHIVVAVNKMDAVDFDREVFARIEAECRGFLAGLGRPQTTFIPVSALRGDNVVKPSDAMPWYQGPTLLHHLETIDVETRARLADLRLPVQLVLRRDSEFRGYTGTIKSGGLHVGDDVLALPSGRSSRVKSILVAARPAESATAGDAVTITLTDEVDVGRGDVFVHPTHSPGTADRFEAQILWMNEVALQPARVYDLKFGHRYVIGQVERIEHRVDITSFAPVPAEELAINDIGLCVVSTTVPVVLDPYDQSRSTGSFIVIDRLTQATVGAGMVVRTLRARQDAANASPLPIRPHATSVTREQRAATLGQRPWVLWFTGLSGAGKSTVANALELELHRRGLHTYLLDGDNVRAGLNRDLDFSRAGRIENLRRVAEVARLMTDAGLLVLTAFISPFRSDRDLARELIGPADFVEVYLSTPLAICEARDPKGLYQNARRSSAKDFTGISSPYEPPVAPDLEIDTSAVPIEAAVDRIIAFLTRTGRLPSAGGA
jgi:bifunctional enzyme CysN/CysC